MKQELARNTADRATRHINRVPAVNIHHATRYAQRQGLPLNRMVTVNFTELDAAGQASRLFRRMLAQRFAPWLRRSVTTRARLAPTYVWVVESTANTTAAHWLVHIPKGATRAFAAKLSAWFESLTGSRPQARTIQIERVYNLIGARRYVLKGVNPAWANHLGVRPSDQGIVNGKRSGFSRNLGPTARKAGGYVPRRHGYRTF
jgi:hypothetical protein